MVAPKPVEFSLLPRVPIVMTMTFSTRQMRPFGVCFSLRWRHGMSLLAVLLACSLPLGAAAQSVDPPSNNNGLPEWAAPQDHQSSSPRGTIGAPRTRSTYESSVSNGGPTLHSPPSGGLPGGGSRNIPVDGGLGLLAAAGAAYAIRELRKNGSSDDPTPDDPV